MQIAIRGKRHCLLLRFFASEWFVWDFQKTWGDHWYLRVRVFGRGFNLYWDNPDFT